MTRLPFSVVTVEIVGDTLTVCGAFRVLSGLIADAVEETRRSGHPVAEIRIAGTLLGRVIVQDGLALSGESAPPVDPDRYMRN